MREEEDAFLTGAFFRETVLLTGLACFFEKAGLAARVFFDLTSPLVVDVVFRASKTIFTREGRRAFRVVLTTAARTTLPLDDEEAAAEW